jgi:hypothetical protein
MVVPVWRLPIGFVAVACSNVVASEGTGAAGGIGNGGSGAGTAPVTASGAGGAAAGGLGTTGGGGATLSAGGVVGGSAGGMDVAGQSSGAGGALTPTAGTAAGGSSGRALFNGVDLSGFDVFREPSTKLSPEQASAIFKVEGGAIRVYGDAPDQSTQARYTLVTAGSYSKYRLSLEYRWGQKKFAPYTDLVKYPRDAGVLFHLHENREQVWPPSIEFQIKEGTTGDIFAIYARCTSLALNGGTSFVPASAGGTEKLVNGSNGFVQHGRSENFELPEWNLLLLDVAGGSATYSVNGHIVNQVLSVTDKAGSAVTSGPIALQAEHAEVFYRSMVIEELP